MFRRRRLLVAVLLLAGGCGLAVLLLSAQPQRVTLENARRIREGMTLAEVKAILGEPGDHLTRPCGYVRKYAMFDRHPSLAAVQWWLGDDIEIDVAFDGRQIVLETEISDVKSEDVGVVELAEWRIEQAWRRWSGDR